MLRRIGLTISIANRCKVCCYCTVLLLLFLLAQLVGGPPGVDELLFSSLETLPFCALPSYVQPDIFLLTPQSSETYSFFYLTLISHLVISILVQSDPSSVIQTLGCWSCRFVNGLCHIKHFQVQQSTSSNVWIPRNFVANPGNPPRTLSSAKEQPSPVSYRSHTHPSITSQPCAKRTFSASAAPMAF